MAREIAAGIIIYRYAQRIDNRAQRGRKTAEGPEFLILYHGRGYWNFPKGKIESEEKSFQAALRETREETSLNRQDLKLHDNFKTYEKFSFWRKAESGGNQRIFKIVIFYMAETKKADIRLSKEHSGYGWFTYREAMKILSKHKDSQKILEQAHKFLRKNR